METEKNRKLLQLALKRVRFKNHLATFVAVNGMLWLLWYFTEKDDNDNFLWPAWTMLTWGVWLMYDFYEAYIYGGRDAVKREYHNLTMK